MAIPLLFGAAAILASGYGLKKGVKATQKNSEAKNINNKAKALIDNYTEILEQARKTANNELNDLGELKIDIYNSTLKNFVNVFKRIKNVEVTTSTEIEKLKNFDITLKKLETGINLAQNMASGILAGGAAGAVAAFGAYGGVMSFGAASTGTSISMLSGIAARNATLAWLGGGSLASGGLGIAGGTLVLGSTVAGPLLAVFGAVMDSKATANLENAKTNYRIAESHVKEMEIVLDSCKNITKRSKLFWNLLYQLDDLLEPGVDKLTDIVLDEGKDFRNYKAESKEVVLMVAALSKAIGTVINTPILEEDGSLTLKFLDVYNETEEKYSQIQSKFQEVGLLN